MSRLRCFLLCSLLLIGCNTRHQQSDSPPKSKVEVKAPPIPGDVKMLIDTLNKGNLGDADTALSMSLVKQLLLKYPAAKDSFAHYLLLQQMARNYLIRNESDSLIKYASMGLAFFERQAYETKWPFIDHYRLSIASYQNKQYEQSIWHAAKMRQEIKKEVIRKTFPADVVTVYLMDMASICSATLYYKDALSNIALARIISENLPANKSYVHDNVLLETAEIYAELGEGDSVKKYLDRAAARILERPTIATNRRLQSAIANYYFGSGQNDSAIAYLKRYEALNMNQDENALEITNLANFASAYISKNRLPEAGQYLQKGMTAIKEHPEQTDLRDSMVFYKPLTEYMILSGDRKAAYSAFITHLDLELRSVNALHVKEVAEMDARYNLKERERDIANLRNAALEAQLALRRKNQLVGLGFGACAFTLLVGLWAYSLQRQKRLRAEKDKLQQQVSQVQLEQRLLRTQMEPHFIFNSLAVVQSMIRSGEDEKSIRYLNRFAHLLRQSLEHSREALVPLVAELDAIRNYLDLQQMRFEDLFEYKIDVYRGFEEDDVRIPPMLLQPFVENCIQHGFKGIEYTGKIQIKISKNNHVLNITISDNGRGFSKEKAGEGKQPLSTRITRERLGILSRDTGVQSDVQVIADVNGGVIATLVVPFISLF